MTSLLALPGCNGKKGANESVTGVADAICDAAFRCCEASEVAYHLGPFVTADNCADRMRQEASVDASSVIFAPFEGAAVFVPNIGVLQRAIDDDRAEVDGDALAACLDHLATLPCNVLEEIVEEGCVPPEIEEDDPCDPELILRGRVGEGGACSSPGFSFECKEGLMCQSFDSLGVDGVCVQPGLEGDYCFSDNECDRDLYCQLLDGTCQLPSQKGQACLYAHRDDLTPSQNTLLIKCDGEQYLTCDPVTDTCVSPCERGYRCDSDDDCDEEAGLFCIFGRCDSKREVGFPCTTSLDCEDGLHCMVNPATNSDTICLPPIKDGDDCSTSAHEQCESGFCDPDSFTCAPQVSPPGLCPSYLHQQCAAAYCDTTYQYCTADGDCSTLSGTCDTANFRCMPFCVTLQTNGGMCTYDYECESDACVNGFCRVLPLANGQPCTSGAECASLFCNYETMRECEELPLPNGRVCASSAECESGVCHEGSCQNGLSEGDDCSSFLDPPCGRELYCDGELDPPTCVPVLEAGELCDSSVQCRGNCVFNFNRYMCDSTPVEDAVVCDGE